jgi:hypothetical protein
MAKTRRRHSHRQSRSKNMVKRTFKKGFRTSKKGFNAVTTTSKKGLKKGLGLVKSTIPLVKTTSKKYMPQVKTGLENVGSKVTKTATKSVPILQKASRDLLGVIGIKKSH